MLRIGVVSLYAKLYGLQMGYIRWAGSPGYSQVLIYHTI